jgi:hypothetical protein
VAPGAFVSPPESRYPLGYPHHFSGHRAEYGISMF